MRIANVLTFDALWIIAAVAAGIASWAQTRQYGQTQRAYGIAAQELATIKAEAALTTEDDWPRFVAEAEEAISREHVLCRASRGLLVRRR